MGNFKVCIVGAGPGGLAMARALTRHGIDYDHFERHGNVGGIWDQANPGSPMYDSAHMISSRTLSALQGFPMPADYPDYPGHRKVLDYLAAFADAYGLRQRITFNTEVRRAERAGEKWMVKFADGTARPYDAFVAAVGLSAIPRMPAYPGPFTGTLIHSHQYRAAEVFAGKRVLVIGAGNSGVDIAADASRTADRAFLSMRRAYHFVPKHIFGQPADVFAQSARLLPLWSQRLVFGVLLRILNGDLRRHGLPKPDHQVLASHPIVNSSALHAIVHGDLTPKPDIESFDGKIVHFADGTSEEIDLIVAATGYAHTTPLVDADVLDFAGARTNLFLRTFSRRYPTFMALGLIETNGGIFPFYDQFADIGACYFSHLASGDPSARKFEVIAQSGDLDVAGPVTYVDSPRHKVYANVQATAKALNRLRKTLGWPAPSDAAMTPQAFLSAKDAGRAA